VPEEDIIAQDEAHSLAGDEFAAHEECIRQTARFRLLRIGKRQTPLRAVAQQLFKKMALIRHGDHQDLANIGQHQHRERVIDHGLVVDRQQLFAGADRDRMQPRAAAAGQNDTLHAASPRRS